MIKNIKNIISLDNILEYKKMRGINYYQSGLINILDPESNKKSLQMFQNALLDLKIPALESSNVLEMVIKVIKS